MATTYSIHTYHLRLYQALRMGLAPILCICICISIDAMLIFDGDFDIDANAGFVAVTAALKLCFTSGCVVVLDKEGSGWIPDRCHQHLI